MQIVQKQIKKEAKMIKRKFVLILLCLSLMLVSCTSMKEIQSDNISEIVKEKQTKIENEMQVTPAKLQIPIDDGFLIKAEDSQCKISEDVDIEFIDADIKTIISSLYSTLNIGVIIESCGNAGCSGVLMSQPGTTEKQGVPAISVVSSQNEPLLTLKYKGKVDNLLKLLSQKTGYFFNCHDDRTIVVEKSKIFNISVPNYPDLLKHLKESIEKLGGFNIAYNNLTTTLSFTADYNSYERIRKFLEGFLKNASLINLKIVLLSVSFSSDKNIGINWSGLNFGWGSQKMKSIFDSQLIQSSDNNINNNGSTSESTTTLRTTTETLYKTGVGVVTNDVGALVFLERNKFTLSGLLSFLESYGKYSILQDVYIQTLSGVKGKIEVAREIPYIKEVSLSTSGTSGTTIGTATSEKAKSGVEMEVLPYYDKSFDVLSINLKVNVSEVVRLITLNAGQQIGNITQPETAVKKVDTYIRMSPEQVVLLGGLIYEKELGTTHGLPGFDTVLTKEMNRTKTKEELVILVKPTIIEFVPLKKSKTS